MNFTYFTPSMSDPALLEAIFTARTALADLLMSRIRDGVESGNRHYMLLIGPRGIGKSHLISLIEHRVKKDPLLHERLRIAWLVEDPYAVNSYTGLLREIISQLDREYSVPRWDEHLSTIQDMNAFDDIERALERVLVGFLAGRMLLVLAENLDMIFDSLGDTGQKKLRAFLQTTSLATLLVTSPSLIPAAEERDRPFFGFFRNHELLPFGLQECIDVLVRMAQSQNDTELARMLQSPTGRARIRAIHHIAGGNPRIYVIFYQFLTRDSLDKLSEPFIKLVNDLLPYYQSRMQTISPQQRQLVDLLCRNESPMAVRDIAKATFASSQSVSSDLGKLRDLGYLISTKLGRESLYELREPLMRICLSSKQQRGQALPLFIEFLRLWFTPAELQNFGAMSARQIPEYQKYDGAIQAARKQQQARIAFELQRIGAFTAEGLDDVALELLRKLFVSAPQDLDVWLLLRSKLEDAKQFVELIDLVRQRLALEPNSAADWNYLNFACYNAGEYGDALAASFEATRLDPEEPVYWSNHLSNLVLLRRHDDCRRAAAQALSSVEHGTSFQHSFLVATCQRHLGDIRAATQTMLTELRLDRSDYSGWRLLHVLLEDATADRARNQLSEFAVTRFPFLAVAWRDRATALAANDNNRDALIALDKAISLAPSDAEFSCQRLYFLIGIGDLAASRLAAEHTRDCIAELGASADISAIRALALLHAIDGDEVRAREMLRLYCRVLQESNDLHSAKTPIMALHLTRDPLVLKRCAQAWVDVFAEFDALAVLGAALVGSIFLYPVSTGVSGVADEAIREWRDAWNGFTDIPALALPLRLMDVAVRFRETGQEATLLELPVEQREILLPRVARYRRALGLAVHELDEPVAAMIASVRDARENRQLVSAESPPAPLDVRLVLKDYSARRRVDDPLPRLIAGDWTAIPKNTAAALMEIFNLDQLGLRALRTGGNGNLSIARIDRTPLSFSSGALYQAHVELDGRVGAFDFWSDEVRVLLLDGTGTPIRTFFGEFKECLVLTPENELDYVRFFCEAIHSEGGRFRIVDAQDPAFRTDLESRLSDVAVPRPRRETVDGERRYVEAVVYADYLYEAHLVIDRTDSGPGVNMLDDQPISSAPLGLRNEEFSGPVRFWKAATAED